MTADKTEEHLFDIVSKYFVGATVTWEKAAAVKPHSPVIALSMGPYKRPYQAIAETINGVPINSRELITSLQIDLFTKGELIGESEYGKTEVYRNTAVSDMLGFLDFIDSPYVLEWCNTHNVTILPMGDVQDLTAIINDTTWNYRSMVELEVRFTHTAVGAAGVLAESSIKYPGEPDYPPVPDPDNPKPTDPYYPIPNPNPTDPYYPLGGETPTIVPEWNKPTASGGGGTQELADETTGYFEKVEIQEESE